ncbi:metallophosphoesterase [Nocardioides sp. LML1-1-1.1]|uniref:metallophosphoesterase n=1 Tax=Nocardioides sp. LML1-1-1.1 TaxID=3135248 RepID=UPI003420444E
MAPGIPLRLLRLALGGVAWVVLSLGIAAVIFAGSERTIDLASHEATVSPDFSGEIVLRTGPVLPDLRADSGSRLGLDIELGKTDTTSLQELTARYAAIASQPDGQVDVVERAVRTMAVAALVQGAALAALPFAVWAAIGAERRRALLRALPTGEGFVVVLTASVLVVALVAPLTWGRRDPLPQRWMTLGAYVGDDIPLPDEARKVEIMGDVTTEETKRLIASAVSSYQQGQAFYSKAADDAADLDLREPAEDETVALLVSDRHLNVGMDKVARAIGDRAGATAVYDAGDDTSTGERWEAFSLDSVTAAFRDVDDRFAVAGNHDNGSFVRAHMSDEGWRYFDGTVLDGPGGSRILGVDDPRSSGLGNWRDEKGLSSADVAERLTEAVCDADEKGDRVNTLLLHDADFGDQALARGCVDLVVGGHVHVQSGPTEVTGTGGRKGWTYTVGTTGGAAYAIAIGSKLRRAAGVALITYRDGRPVGIQSVTLQTNGRYDVDPWVELTY